MKGRFIVFEGLDGVGKTTLVRRLAAKLDAVLLSTPDASIRSERASFDALYQSTPDAGHLFYAAAVAHASAVASFETARGRDVVLDRYWLSTWAYAILRGTTLRLGGVESRLLAADFTFLVTLDERERHARLQQRGATAGDRATLDTAVARTIEQRYRRGLGRRVAGRGCVLDVSGKNEDEGVAAILAVLGCATR